MSVSINGTNGLTFGDGSAQNTGGYTGFRNRIINGDMRIDQRNAGASVNIPAGSSTYVIDRWLGFGSNANRFSMQRNAGAVTPPVGFTNYLGMTSLSSYSTPAGEAFLFAQYIEGFNTADLAWGTASAQTVTLSFWVRSSLTGTFSVSVCNFNSSRNYISTYTISAANTWEYKTITVPGDTAGTWSTDNGIGFQIRFDLGSGSSFFGAAGSWSSSNLTRTSGSQSIVGTNGATFYITGVQLEKGSVATPFENRPYGTELQLCQRYYYSSTGQSYWFFPPSTGDPNGKCSVMFKQTMRTSPACTATKSGGGSSTITFDTITIDGVAIAIQSWGNNAAQLQSLTASAEL